MCDWNPHLITETINQDWNVVATGLTEKNSKDNDPQTICRLKKKGLAAFEQYFKNIKQYRKPKK